MRDFWTKSHLTVKPSHRDQRCQYSTGPNEEGVRLRLSHGTTLCAAWGNSEPSCRDQGSQCPYKPPQAQLMPQISLSFLCWGFRDSTYMFLPHEHYTQLLNPPDQRMRCCLSGCLLFLKTNNPGSVLHNNLNAPVYKMAIEIVLNREIRIWIWVSNPYNSSWHIISIIYAHYMCQPLYFIIIILLLLRTMFDINLNVYRTGTWGTSLVV